MGDIVVILQNLFFKTVQEEAGCGPEAGQNADKKRPQCLSMRRMTGLLDGFLTPFFFLKVLVP